MTGQTKTKPKCIKGTACGYSCISGKKQCSSRILKRDADALIKAATEQPKSKPEAIIDFDLDGLMTYWDVEDLSSVENLTVGKHKVKISITSSVYDAQSVLNVSVEVNNSYSTNLSGVSASESIRVALVATRATLKAIAKLPDGTVLRNFPYDGDNSFEARKRMYQKMGFGEYDKDTERQYGIVYKGKVRPMTYSQYRDKI